jgi:hypothetical protein
VKAVRARSQQNFGGTKSTGPKEHEFFRLDPHEIGVECVFEFAAVFAVPNEVDGPFIAAGGARLDIPNFTTTETTS